MRLKHGVRLTDLAPQMVLAAVVVERVMDKHGVECVITSANDSKHGDKSLHYSGKALDFRTKYASLNGKEKAIRDEIKENLGPDFDVLIEAAGTDNEHLHLEYDVKG